MQPLMRVEALVKTYRRPGAVRQQIRALDGVSLDLFPAATLAVVGESGSGKSTLAQCMSAQQKPTAGKIWLGQQELTSLSENRLRKIRPRIQLIFQDASAAMNPRLCAAEIVSEPLLFGARTTRGERWQRACELMELVGLDAAAGRRLADFSGGQRQRLAIARALAANPEVLILDESLSALDCPVQAQIANLLLELQQTRNLACVFITHDFAMAAHLADEIAVMDRGCIVETGATRQITQCPTHPQTQALLAAVPRLPTAALPVLEEA